MKPFDIIRFVIMTSLCSAASPDYCIGQSRDRYCTCHTHHIIVVDTKGQLISKCLFGVFNFLQKTNKNKSHGSKIEFLRSFFGGNLGLKKSFRFCLTFNPVIVLFLTSSILPHICRGRGYTRHCTASHRCCGVLEWRQ